MENENRQGGNIWRVIALVLMVVMAAMIGVLLVMRDGKIIPSKREEATTQETAAEDTAGTGDATGTDGSEAEPGQEEAAAGSENEPEQPVMVEEGKEYDIRMTFADGFYHERIAGLPVYINQGRDNMTNETMKAYTTDKNGRITEKLPAGEYTVLWGNERYYDGYETITIGGEKGPGYDFMSDNTEQYAFWQNVVPRQDGDAIVFVLEWVGSEDLDLCVFNASENKFISAVQPNDGKGGFLVADDYDGSPGFEVVVIKDYKASDIYTPYVRDGNALMRGTFSSMEANGVRLSVLNKDGLRHCVYANPSEHAGLWMPCYVLKGEVIKDSQYEYDPARYAWAAFAK